MSSTWLIRLGDSKRKPNGEDAATDSRTRNLVSNCFILTQKKKHHLDQTYSLVSVIHSLASVG